MTRVESKFIPGPTGRLDSRWHGVLGGAPVLILHPHPLLGGTMGSRLVYDLTMALAEDGSRVVRFDFRGIGRSDGTYDQGEGEALDACAMWDALQNEAGRAPTVIGYSFGGGVATRLATLRPVERLLLIGTQPRVFQSHLAPIEDAAFVQANVHLIAGEQDQFVSPIQTKELAAAFASATTRILPRAGHFLEPTHNPAAVAVVRQFLA